ncbi:MAG TPA: hypothetical protein VEP90_11575 [Methylomirabilota bacterium]|nr:hypothetical protein [Methylomirabilota bacterium]
MVFQILQSFANDEVQFSLVCIDVKSGSKNNKNNNPTGGGNNNNSRFDVDGKCKKCGKKYYSDCKWYEICKSYYKGSDDVCFFLYLKFREQFL